MKKQLLLTFLLGIVCCYNTFSQEEDTTTKALYNKWSIDISAGLNKPVRPVVSGAFSSTPSPFTVNLGARYMFNTKAGLRAGLGYNSFTEGDANVEFESTLYTFSLEGVINLGNVLDFKEWTQDFSILAHGGMGYGRLTSKTPVDRSFGDADQVLSAIVGISPQVRLSDRISLFGDVTAVGNIRQNLTFDGSVTNRVLRGFDGFYITGTVGVNIALGKSEVHADWYVEETIDTEKIDGLEERLAKVETDLIDTDQDGVADYLDREKNTVSGVAVDTKGYAVDLNKNGIPDELEAGLEAQYAKKSDLKNLSSGGSSDIIAKLLNDGYVNVYFQFNSTKPELYSLDAINYLIKYLSANPSKKAELIGYADEVGNATYNQQLSEKRAKRVFNILVASGIDANRLSITGAGEDTGITDTDARQLVRRVTFKLK